MRSIKKIGLLVLFMIILIGGSGCMKLSLGKPDRGEIAQTLLKEKYKEDFKVYGSGQGFGSLTGNTFMVVAAPVSNENLKFEATVEKDGAYIIDEYIQALLEDQIKTIMSEEMGALADDYYLKVYVAYADSTVNKNSISIEQYNKEYPNIPIVIDLLLNRDKLKNENPEQEYAVLSGLFLNKLPITAALDIYYTTEDTLQECEKYFTKNAESYEDFNRMVEGSKIIPIGIEKGQFINSLGEFLEQRMER